MISKEDLLLITISHGLTYLILSDFPFEEIADVETRQLFLTIRPQLQELIKCLGAGLQTPPQQ